MVAWHRVGALLCAIAVSILHMPLMRYVDDYFGLERQETAEHAMQCFARIVRALISPSAIAASKLEWGSQLTILGMQVTPSAAGMRLKVCPIKATKWLTGIDDALQSGLLSAGAASKLAGRLQWAVQHLFFRSPFKVSSALQ